MNASAQNAAAAATGFNPVKQAWTAASGVVLEATQLLPDGIILASALFALATLSMPFGLFFGTMVESAFIYKALAYMGSFLNVNYPAAAVPGVPAAGRQCRTGFLYNGPLQDLNTLSMFKGPSDSVPFFPSAPVFMVGTAAAYLFGTLQAQSKELEALGPAYSSRFYVSLFSLSALVLLMILYRTSQGCESFGSILITFPLAIFVGLMLVAQNRRLFGEESINLLGIPLLRNRAANGKRLYICPTQVK